MSDISDDFVPEAKRRVSRKRQKVTPLQMFKMGVLVKKPRFKSLMNPRLDVTISQP